MAVERPAPAAALSQRIAQLDWQAIGADLDAHGFATTGPVLTEPECRIQREAYDDDGPFRSRVVMARHSFGSGEYKYYDYPLPPVIAGMRGAFYAHLAPVANRWQQMNGGKPSYPDRHETYLERCHAAGQQRATPLLLRYDEGDYNCLHQDLYGDLVFPLQVALLLSDPQKEFSGGEFVLTEQRPRMQSRASVAPLGLGEAVIFAVNERPVEGKRGPYRVRMRHGVSRVRSGRRHVLGLIFHDAS